MWNKWRWRLRDAGLHILVAAIVGGLGYYWWTHLYAPARPSSILTPSLADDSRQPAPLWKKPTNAPNGKPWPTESGYIEGYPRLNVGGGASIIADNTGGTADLMLKLIDRERTPMTAVRIVFVKAKSQFQMNRVKSGQYDVRYLNLDSGRIRKSQTFEVTLKTTEKGQEYMGWRVGLFDTLSGNSHHEDIGASDF